MAGHPRNIDSPEKKFRVPRWMKKGIKKNCDFHGVDLLKIKRVIMIPNKIRQFECETEIKGNNKPWGRVRYKKEIKRLEKFINAPNKDI